MANRMILNETAWFGRGAVGALTDEVKRRGYQKALIVTDKTLVQCGVVAKVTDKMGRGKRPPSPPAPPVWHCDQTGQSQR